jgi:hypothetical protein
MTRLKIAGAALLLSAIAAPVMAQEAAIPGPGSRYGLEPEPGGPTYYRSYDEYDAPLITAPRYYRDDGFYFGYRDRSRVGGYSPSWNPPGS